MTVVTVVVLAFAVPFCIASGVATAILFGMWLEKKLGLKS